MHRPRMMRTEAFQILGHPSGIAMAVVMLVVLLLFG
jgi:hypothetical protein